MSRIVVKQLPKNVTEDKLKEIFSKKGNITDIQLKYNPDGKFRQYCFIGYHSADEANAAVNYFNNSCIYTNRIKVELCAALGKDDKAQVWSKYAKDGRKAINENKTKLREEKKESVLKKEKIPKVLEILGDHKDDPEFQEFLKLHDRKRILWANDVIQDDAGVAKQYSKSDVTDNEENLFSDSGAVDQNKVKSKEESLQHQDDEGKEPSNDKIAEKPISDLEYMKSLMNKTKLEKKIEKKSSKDSLDLFTIKIHNIPYKVKRGEILKFFKPLKPYSVRLPTKVHGFCYVGFKTEKDMIKAMVKNKSFIKGKQVFFSDFTEKNKITKSNNKNSTNEKDQSNASMNPKWAKQLESQKKEEDISESGCIFFRNLPYTVTDDNLQKLFEKFGPVAEINLPVDSITRQIKGFGTVTFVMPEHAMQAFNNLDGTDFHGRLLHLIPGRSRDKDTELDENDALLTFKEKQAIKLKKTANQQNTWNSLFLGQNAVAEILANQFGMSKEKILDTSDGGSNAAVRMALGETQIVIEMKKFLEEQGVCLSAFDGTNIKRSKTIILAKNLPAETTIAELTPIFTKFGPLGRIVLPPSGVTALIEYCDPSEARQAFKKLAYSKFKHAPLYLEWAPENSFKTTFDGQKIERTEEESVTDGNKIETTVVATNGAKTEDIHKDEEHEKENEIDNENDDDDELPESNTTLFLRNLNFKTVQQTVYNHFKFLGPIHTVEIAKRKDPENPRIMKSLGYGFIQFKKTETADNAIKNMQFTNIDGNEVELKRSDRILKNQQTTQRRKVNQTKQTGTKILVRNIPFQANAHEVRAIFKAFGEIRSLRLPMKMTPGEETHRGFGFVDFVTKGDAKKAFDALSFSTHLYGRRLVLEWASIDDEDINELRKRTAIHLDGSQKGGKRSKKSIFNADGSIATTDVEKDLGE